MPTLSPLRGFRSVLNFPSAARWANEFRRLQRLELGRF